MVRRRGSAVSNHVAHGRAFILRDAAPPRGSQDEDLAVLGPAISFGKWPEICMDVIPITANLGGVGA